MSGGGATLYVCFEEYAMKTKSFGRELMPSHVQKTGVYKLCQLTNIDDVSSRLFLTKWHYFKIVSGSLTL